MKRTNLFLTGTLLSVLFLTVNCNEEEQTANDLDIMQPTIRSTEDGVLILQEDKHGFQFQLPPEWTIHEDFPPENSDQELFWQVLLYSPDQEMAIRIGHRQQTDSNQFLNDFMEYVSARAGVQSEAELDQLASRMTPIPAEQLQSFGAEQGTNIRLTQSGPSEDEWRSEHLIVLKKGADHYIFSFLARDDFPHDTGDNQATATDPLLLFTLSMKIE